MGNPYIDMLEKTDGLSVEINTDNIEFKNSVALVPVKVINHFNTSIDGILNITIKDVAQQKNITQRTIPVKLLPYQVLHYRFNLPNESGIQFSYSFTQTNTLLHIYQT
jgi:alpha-galactosidase